MYEMYIHGRNLEVKFHLTIFTLINLFISIIVFRYRKSLLLALFYVKQH